MRTKYLICVFSIWFFFQKGYKKAGGGGSVAVCSACDRVYSSRLNLSNHILYECGKEPQFQCLQCNFCSKLKGNLKKHFIRIHGAISDDEFNRMYSSKPRGRDNGNKSKKRKRIQKVAVNWSHKLHIIRILYHIILNIIVEKLNICTNK